VIMSAALTRAAMKLDRRLEFSAAAAGEGGADDSADEVAISMGVASVSTSLAASRSTSYWPERISASMIPTPVSRWSREARPATRYQTDSARARGSKIHSS
jgi:hypothetical protein